MQKKIWQVFPQLTERIYKDHAEAGMFGGHHDAEHAVRVAQMAFELSEPGRTASLAGAAGLCHNADRILQHKLKLGSRRDAPKGAVRKLVDSQLREEAWFGGSASVLSLFGQVAMDWRDQVVDAVLKHDGKNDPSDPPELVALMDADRLVNAEPDLIIRSAQLYNDLPPVDPIHFWSDPAATYRDPRSVLRDIMETIVWLTPGTDFYVRLPKAREMAAERKKFFDAFGEELVARRQEAGLHPYPEELLALRTRFAGTT